MSPIEPAPVPRSQTRVGVDVVDVARLQALILRRPRVVERLFTDDERGWCEQRRSPWAHYAARFAAKEAVRKALGRACRWRDVEVRRARSGAPHLALGHLATDDGAPVLGASLSLTHDGGVAVAVVVLDVGQPSPVESNPSR